MTHPLVLDIEANTASLGTRRHGFTRRYEALFLAALAELNAATPATALSSAAFQHAAAAHGQKQELNKKQLSRILENIEAGLAEIGIAQKHALIKSARSTRTLGPWWWPALATLSVAALPQQDIAKLIKPAAPADEATPKFKLVNCETGAAARAVLWEIFHADAAAVAGAPERVIEIIEPLLARPTSTHEAKILLHLRLARAHGTLRDFKAARTHTDAARALASGTPALAALHGPTITYLAQRQRYDEAPTASAAALRLDLTRSLAGLVAGSVPSLSPHPLAHSYSLRGLATRRAIEALPPTSTHADAAALIGACVGDFVSALYCLLATSDLEATQNTISNLAYAVQQIALRGWHLNAHGDAHGEVAAWYHLAISWHNEFHLTEGNIWESIFIGEYWLAAKQNRPSFNALQAVNANAAKAGKAQTQPQATAPLIWQGHHPAELQFYEHALARARELNEPKQMLYAALNQHRFCTEFANVKALGRALEAIREIRQIYPELVRAVEAEGYEVPRGRR